MNNLIRFALGLLAFHLKTGKFFEHRNAQKVGARLPLGKTGAACVFYVSLAGL